MGWREFWDGEHAIYAGVRHKAVHYAAIADGILEHVNALPDAANAVVLDYACGEALEAGRVAEACGRLVLCDGAPSIVAMLAARHADEPAVSAVLPEALDGALGPNEADLIVVCSLIQYLDKPTFAALLARLADLAKPGGRVVVADVIPPDAGLLADVTSLLGNAARHGYLMAATGSLVANFFSPYRKMRQELGLTAYAEAEMLETLASAGLTPRRYQPNLGLTARRMTFVGEKAL